MELRRRSLPEGWYPREAGEVRRLVETWRGAGPPLEVDSRAVVAPHAGWAFSGRLAALAWSTLASSAGAGAGGTVAFETVVIAGGHLRPSSPLLYAPEGAFETPFGPREADGELLRALLEAAAGWGLRMAPDRDRDNSVEVQLPFAALFAPRARILWLRLPPSSASIEAGLLVHEAAKSLGRRLAFLASTDLTHYGPDYDFEPRGRGGEAEAWVRGVNDRAFIDACLARDPELVLARARADRSACSAGAVAAALAFAEREGATRASLLDYSTSLDVRRADSFVGYAALGLS